MTTRIAPSESGDYSVVTEDEKVIGTANLTNEQFRHYQEMAKSPEGWIRVGALPSDFYDLASEHQDTHDDTNVYIRPE